MSNEASTPKRVVYSDELYEEAMSLIAEGWAISKVVKLPHMPCSETFHKWARVPERAGKLARAREFGAEYFSERVLSVVDSVECGFDPQAARAMIYGLEKAHAMRKPKEIKLSGKVEGNEPPSMRVIAAAVLQAFASSEPNESKEVNEY